MYTLQRRRQHRRCLFWFFYIFVSCAIMPLQRLISRVKPPNFVDKMKRKKNSSIFDNKCTRDTCQHYDDDACTISLCYCRMLSLNAYERKMFKNNKCLFDSNRSAWNVQDARVFCCLLFNEERNFSRFPIVLYRNDNLFLNEVCVCERMAYAVS